MHFILILFTAWMSAITTAKESPVRTYAKDVPPEQRLPYDEWIQLQDDFAMASFMAHSSPPDGLPGSVIASPERGDPDYYYHWVRDAALAMNTVADIADRGEWDYRQLERMLTNFAAVSRLHQEAMEQPKFHVDGRPFTGEWCRPQNDGPALRAIALLRLANMKLNSGDADYVYKELYDGKLPTDSLIKRDLEFVAHHWHEPTCDLWEEYYGDHFYTRMVQRKALIEGAKLADKMGDPLAASYYRRQSADLEAEILKHWDPQAGIFRVTRNYVAYPGANWTFELQEKADGIDGSVILGFLHGHTDDGFLNFTDPRVLSTLDHIKDHFKRQYLINNRPRIPGIGIGRYTNDTFNKVRGRYGNPWFLLTAAAGQAYLRAADETIGKGDTAEALRLFRLGDSFLRRVHHHAGGSDIMDEQFDQFTGEMTSAPDLAWSNKEMADAAHIRNVVREKLNRIQRACELTLRTNPR